MQDRERGDRGAGYRLYTTYFLPRPSHFAPSRIARNRSGVARIVAGCARGATRVQTNTHPTSARARTRTHKHACSTPIYGAASPRSSGSPRSCASQARAPHRGRCMAMRCMACSSHAAVAAPTSHAQSLRVHQRKRALLTRQHAVLCSQSLTMHLPNTPQRHVEMRWGRVSRGGRGAVGVRCGGGCGAVGVWWG